MAILRGVVAGVAWLLACLGQSAGAERVMVPVPTREGCVSLGIFDGQGRLVRALAQAEPVSNLNIGLDGLVLEWDGRDSSGNLAAPGPWTARGFFIPQRTRVRGEAFHFNDWVEEEAGEVPAEVVGLIPLPGKRFAMIGRLEGVEGLGVWECIERASLKCVHGGISEFLAGADRGMACWKAERGQLLWLPLFHEGSEVLAEMPAPPFACAHGESLWVLEANSSLARRLQPSPLALPVPPGARLLACAGQGIFVGGEGKLWFVRSGEEAREIPCGEPSALWSLAAGPQSTLWISGADGDGPFVRQISEEGEILRELELEPGVTFARVFSNADALRIYVLEQRGERERVFGLEPAESSSQAPGVSDWLILWDRTITKFRDFGFSGSQVVATGAGQSPASFRVRLSPSHWQTQPGILEVKLMPREDGLWVATQDGLLLVRVCAPVPPRFAARWNSEPGQLHVLAARPSVVEEFVVEHLGKLIPLEAGELGGSP